MRKMLRILCVAFLFAAATAIAQQGIRIDADMVNVTKTSDGATLIVLKGAPKFHVGDRTFSVSDGSKYHPEQNLLEADFVKTATPLSGGGELSCRGNRVRLTLPNGVSIEAPQMCVDGVLYSCKDGNLMQDADAPVCL